MGTIRIWCPVKWGCIAPPFFQLEGYYKLFDTILREPSQNISIHIIDIKALSPSLINYLDEHFVSICEGDSGTKLSAVKKIIIDFLNTKDSRTKMGATAEFFLHLYLKHIGFKQECLFLNLEERSIKKGFDGYYSLNDDEYIMESKSGSSKTNNISHNKKVKEAYTDLKERLAGKKGNNNPWKNAYNHASHIDVGTDSNIRKNIKQLSDNYQNSIYYEISDFNIIPASTIFLEDIWIDVYSKEIVDTLETLSSTLEFKKLNIICITKKSLNMFQTYLEE